MERLIPKLASLDRRVRAVQVRFLQRFPLPAGPGTFRPANDCLLALSKTARCCAPTLSSAQSFARFARCFGRPPRTMRNRHRHRALGPPQHSPTAPAPSRHFRIAPHTCAISSTQVYRRAPDNLPCIGHTAGKILPVPKKSYPPGTFPLRLYRPSSVPRKSPVRDARRY